MGKPEGLVENHLVRRCKERGWMQFKFTAPGRRGVPDRIVIADGVVAFVELKSPVGTPSKIQKSVIADMCDNGAVCYVCASKDEVDAALSEIADMTPSRGRKPYPPRILPKRKPKSEQRKEGT